LSKFIIPTANSFIGQEVRAAIDDAVHWGHDAGYMAGQADLVLALMLTEQGREVLAGGHVMSHLCRRCNPRPTISLHLDPYELKAIKQKAGNRTIAAWVREQLGLDPPAPRGRRWHPDPAQRQWSNTPRNMAK
jgi:hypothetical protein